MKLDPLLKKHKKTIFFGNQGVSLDCVIKPYPSHEGYPVKLFTSFTGLTLDENGFGSFADTFEGTINLDELFEHTREIPTRKWCLSVIVPQMNNETVSMCIESVAIDRTLGMCLLRCTAATTKGEGKRIERERSGGI